MECSKDIARPEPRLRTQWAAWLTLIVGGKHIAYDRSLGVLRRRIGLGALLRFTAVQRGWPVQWGRMPMSRNDCGSCRAFTIVEALVVVVIAAVLMALLVPVLGSAKRGAQIQSSVSKMRQLGLSLEMYRADWGSEGIYDYYAAGIPPSSYQWPIEKSFWRSPCGADRTIFLTAMPPYVQAGEIAFVAILYEPVVLTQGSANVVFYGKYLETYRQNAVMFIDYYCNDAGTSMHESLMPKRGIALLLSGQVVNRVRVGDGMYLQFYSDPPKE